MTRHIYFTNRKEYYRRKKISASLKRYHAKPKLIKIKKDRVRKQVCYNFKYSQSLRAITINNDDITEKRLKDILEEFLLGNKNLLHFSPEKQGYEEEEIDSDEDKNFKDGKIYLEINFDYINWNEVIEK